MESHGGTTANIILDLAKADVSITPSDVRCGSVSHCLQAPRCFACSIVPSICNVEGSDGRCLGIWMCGADLLNIVSVLLLPMISISKEVISEEIEPHEPAWSNLLLKCGLNRYYE